MFSTGYELHSFTITQAIRELVRQENWAAVDQELAKLTAPEGAIFQFLLGYYAFSKIEIMISIRDGSNEFEEDGIWHDDGSRVFAFSLSLTESAETIEGGCLELRKINQSQSVMIPTPEFGTAILFLTGVHGYEHRTRKVEKGRRIILVGWCS